MKDGAIPAKYKLLMAMITDAIAAHPTGVRTLAAVATTRRRGVPAPPASTTLSMDHSGNVGNTRNASRVPVRPSIDFAI
jgi:hypothetical protein